MKLSGVTPITRSLLPILVIVAVLAFLLATPDSTVQARFNYSYAITTKYCNALPSAAPFTTFGIGGNPACTNPVPTALAATTTTTRLDIPVGELNFSLVATFIPPDATVTPGTSIPVGDIVGGLESAATLGIGNGECGTGVPVPFILYNVALPDNPADPRASGNIYVPYPEGTSSDQSGITDPETGNPSGTIIRGRFENGVPATTSSELLDGVADIAPGSSLAFQEYPDFLLDLFDPDWNPVTPPIDGPDADPGVLNTNNGSAKPVLPLAVYGGITAPQPADDDWIPLYFLVFDKGALPAGGFAPPHPFGSLVSSLGYANITVLTDTSEVVADISLITDFCSSLLTNTMLLGTSVPGGVVRGENPAAGSGRQGTHLGLTFTNSLRDLDNDSFENDLDTCPSLANIDNPQTTTGADLDMLDPACDPDPNLNEAGGPIQCPGQFLAQTQPGDIDGDCFSNAQDNCPQVFNGLPANGGDGQRNSEAFGTYAAAAPDGGPKTDAIGDACDSGTASFTQNNVATSVTLSSTVANGHYHNTGLVSPVCIGGTDADGDGWCAATTGENDGDPNIVPALGLSPPDADGDGFSVWLETAIGTDDTKRCSATSAPGDETVDAYPPDSNNDQFVNITDVNALRPPVFNLLQGNGTNASYTARLDFNADSFINITDVNALRPPVFNLLTPCASQGGPDAQQ